MVAPSVIKINLPKTNAGKAVSKKNIVLAVDSNLTYYLNNKPIAFENIESQLSNYVASDTTQNPTVLLQASKKISVQDLVDVMSLGNKLKLKMVLATTNK